MRTTSTAQAGPETAAAEGRVCAFRRCRAPIPPTSGRGNRPRYCQDGKTWGPNQLSCKAAEAAFLAVASLSPDDTALTPAVLEDLGERLAAARTPLQALLDAVLAVGEQVGEATRAALAERDAALAAAADATGARTLAEQRAGAAEEEAAAAAGRAVEALDLARHRLAASPDFRARSRYVGQRERSSAALTNTPSMPVANHSGGIDELQPKPLLTGTAAVPRSRYGPGPGPINRPASNSRPPTTSSPPTRCTPQSDHSPVFAAPFLADRWAARRCRSRFAKAPKSSTHSAHPAGPPPRRCAAGLRAGEAAYPAGEWAKREREALDALHVAAGSRTSPAATVPSTAVPESWGPVMVAVAGAEEQPQSRSRYPRHAAIGVTVDGCKDVLGLWPPARPGP